MQIKSMMILTFVIELLVSSLLLVLLPLASPTLLGASPFLMLVSPASS